jgi:hypothetical protein
LVYQTNFVYLFFWNYWNFLIISFSETNWKQWSDLDQFFLFYYLQDICAQFELSKNVIGWVVFESRIIFKFWPKIKLKVTRKPRKWYALPVVFNKVFSKRDPVHRINIVICKNISDSTNTYQNRPQIDSITSINGFDFIKLNWAVFSTHTYFLTQST